MARRANPLAKRSWKVVVDQKAHKRLIGLDQDRVIDLDGGIFKAGRDIRLFEKIIIRKDIGFACASGKHVENVLYA